MKALIGKVGFKLRAAAKLIGVSLPKLRTKIKEIFSAL